jgi:hypothetical protein
VVVLCAAAKIRASEREAVMPTAQQDLITPVEHARKELVAHPGADLPRALPCFVGSLDTSTSGLIWVAEDGEDTEGSAHHRM